MKRTSSLNPVARALAQVLLILLMVASLFPLYNVLAASFKSEDEFVANLVLPPKAPMVGNYVHAAIDGLLLRFAANTLILVPIGLVAYLAVCVTAGYAFGKMRFGPKRPLFLLVLFLMIFPQLLLATQVFRLISLLDLTNTGLGVILTWVAKRAIRPRGAHAERRSRDCLGGAARHLPDLPATGHPWDHGRRHQGLKPTRRSRRRPGEARHSILGLQIAGCQEAT